MTKIQHKAVGSITDWRTWQHTQSNPKGLPVPRHWKAGRSSMELARAWFTSPVPVCPPEVRALLDSHPSTRGMVLRDGWVEHETKLPPGGGGRMHDLCFQASVNQQPAVVCIEGKADEPFDSKSIEERWATAVKQNQRRQEQVQAGVAKPVDRTRADERVEALVRMVYGATAQPNAGHWKDRGYQLLTALTGTAIEASKQGAAIGVLIVHVFATHHTEAVKLAANDQDYQDFVTPLLAVSTPVAQQPQLHALAPLPDPDGHAPGVQLWVGKCQYTW